MEQRILQIVLDTPLDRRFDYRWLGADGQVLPHIGQLAIVPFGRREVAGLIVAVV